MSIAITAKIQGKKINKMKLNKNIILFIPFSHVLANWMQFPPTPQKASTIISHLHLSAVNAATFSGVTENQLSGKKENVFFFAY